MFATRLGPLQACLNQSPACVEDWAKAEHVNFDYLYLEEAQNENSAQPSSLLSYELRQDESYTLVFENQHVVIFGRK